MSDVQSAATVQPAIKDVQTLKANLKEQEKRARSEINEVNELAPITDQKPPPAQDGAGEQRKRRKVSNPDGPTKPAEEPVLDGPLPPSSVEPLESSNGAHSNQAPTDDNKDPSLSLAAPMSASPTKTTKSAQPSAVKPTIPDAVGATASAEENNKKKTQPAGVPASSEVPVAPVASKDEPKAQKTDQDKTDAKDLHPEATKAEAEAPTEANGTAHKTVPKPAEAVPTATASS